MPFVSVYVHFVWATKFREPCLDSFGFRQALWKHMKDKALSAYDIYVDTVNGYSDHCHCLVSMGIKYSISKTIQLIKGESSHWINEQWGIAYPFSWQEEYYAGSVSPRDLHRTRRYILNQERHHRKVSLNDEIEFLQNVWHLKRYRN
jgi:putative transposase